ncbi:Uroporphyrinogen-III synthase [Actinobaculum suis]|uniref:Uroporphyrinogen-III synthase n=1 Tax=Actinobaculum suis TaxID=1657 RepID=A0A1G7ADR6_9ACTO|nr:uroporphyrinogen-III synthase [Actinobaculum suis]MDY5152595.1 uroporphyrinogen-III synthase [Actinobaculum suis]SDE12900.1 Uroporphyrinogen-III synthase [Actinobaculum suis]
MAATKRASNSGTFRTTGLVVITRVLPPHWQVPANWLGIPVTRRIPVDSEKDRARDYLARYAGYARHARNGGHARADICQPTSQFARDLAGEFTSQSAGAYALGRQSTASVWLAVTSGYVFDVFRAWELEIPPELQIACIGKGTARHSPRPPDFIGPQPATGRVFGEAFPLAEQRQTEQRQTGQYQTGQKPGVQGSGSRGQDVPKPAAQGPGAQKPVQASEVSPPNIPGRIYFPCSSLASTDFAEAVAARGYQVERHEVYRTEPDVDGVEKVLSLRPAAIVLTAGSAAHAVLAAIRKVLPPENNRTPEDNAPPENIGLWEGAPALVALGEPTARACRQAGYRGPVRVAPTPDPAGIARALRN